MKNKTPKLCDCGCGKITFSAKCLRGHSGHKWVKQVKENYLIECACGCGEKFMKYDKYRNPARQFIHGHNYNSGRYVGYFYSEKNKKNIRYRSSWELTAYQLLEVMSKVSSYTNEPFYVNYEFQGDIKRYYPDILIRYTDNTSEIVEIKPSFLVKLPRNQAKFSAIKKQYDNFSIWTENNLSAFLNKVANSENSLPKGETTPNQAERKRIISLACVETNGQPPKGMI